MRPAIAFTLLAGAALATTGAALVFMGASPEEEAMLHAFDRVLTAMAYAGSGLCFFAIVWAGFVLMAEGGEERGGGQGKGRRRHGGRRPGAGALGQGRRRPAEARRHPIPPNPLEKRKRAN